MMVLIDCVMLIRVVTKCIQINAVYRSVKLFGTWVKNQRFFQLETGPEPVGKSAL